MKKPPLKVEKTRKQYLNFMNFGVKNFITRTYPRITKIKTLTFECYNLKDPME